LASFLRDAPISRKLMWIGLLTAGIAVVSISFILTARNTVERYNESATDLMTFARVLGLNTAAAVAFDDRKAAAETLAAISERADVVTAVVYDNEGKVFAAYGRNIPTSGEIPKPGGSRLTFRRLSLAEPVLFRREQVGTIFLESDLKYLYLEILRDTGVSLLVAFGVFLLVAILFTRLQKAIVSPILGLAGVMQRVSKEQDYGLRVEVQGKDEVGFLSGTFNQMLERIQRRDAELAAHREHLEEEVAQRTAELKQANASLGKLNEDLDGKVKERTKQLSEAQDELVRKEKLAVLGQVAGSVGHELRNPLGVMSNAVYFLQTVLSDADETVKEYLDIIKIEIAGSERIVSDLLDSVRTKPPHPATVDVRILIEQTLRKCTVPANVTLEMDVANALQPVLVDPQQMQQVFRNVITNGIDAMPEGGTMEITTSEDPQANTVIVSIRDSGAGIAPENMARLFQPLFTTKARGIGLGLVVVKNLTQANGGSVTVQSEPGKGTEFVITLPAAGAVG
jgi:signal transduction histidine kinase